MGKSKKQSGSEGADEADAPEALSLEAALEQLEATARRLEQGDLPLEEALALFETGVALTRRCTETLEAAERRIEILVADQQADGGLGTEPFEAGLDVDAIDEATDDEDDDFDEV